jgi:glycosyltransferase involved in cell wall biosynthesis
MDNLTVVVPFWEGHDKIDRLLDSLPDDLPIILVDDQSSVPLQLDRENVRIIRPDEKGFFSGAVNVGVNACDTDVLVLNQDVWFKDERWLGVLNEHREDYDLIGDAVMGHPAWAKGYVQGTFMFVKRKTWEKVGSLNAKDYPLWGATCEWQLRACRMGYKVKPFDGIPGMGHRKKGANTVGPAIRRALKQWPGKRRQFLATPPMISVVIPCFNYGRYLDQAVHSLIGGETSLGIWEPQTFQSFEIIIVDDASTDGSDEKVQAWHDPWRGIRSVLLKKNKGTSGALNEGVKRAFGTYVHILSADDMREPWALEKQYRYSLAHPNSAVYGHLQFFREDKRLKIFRLRDYDFDELIYKNQLPAGIMYPRQAWIDVGGYPEIMTNGREDWAFGVALGVHGYCGVRMPGESGNLVRREDQNRSLRNSGPGWRKRFLTQIMSLYPNIYKGERPVGCCGGRRVSKSRSRSRRSVPAAAAGQAMVARTGFRLIEYIGGNTGSMTFMGPVTERRYKFGDNARDRIGYVDAKDFDEMLAMRRGRKHLFRAYRVVPQKVAVPEPETLQDPLGLEAADNGKGDYDGDGDVDWKDDIHLAAAVLTEKEINTTKSARKLALELGVDLRDITGSGKNGRILKKDVEEYTLEMAR